jgi:hypothetical protein
LSEISTDPERFDPESASTLPDDSAYRRKLPPDPGEARIVHLSGLGAAFLANTFVVFTTSLLLIVVGIAAIWQLCRIIYSHESARVACFTAAGAILAAFVVVLSDKLWDSRRIWHFESHFTKITLDYQLGILNAFSGQEASPTLRKPEDFLGRHEQVCAPRAEHDSGCANIFRIRDLDVMSWLFWAALTVGLGIAVLGSIAGASALAPLDIYTSRAAQAAGGSSLERDAVEYRKRADDMRTVLYYGAVSLAVAVMWVAAQTRWATSPLFQFVPPLQTLVSSFTLYWTLVYVAALGLAYLPPALWLHAQMRDRYNRQITSDPVAPGLRFDEWLRKNEIASPVTARDLLTYVVPLGTLLLSSSFEFGNFSSALGLAN